MAAEIHQEGLQYLLETSLSEEQVVPATFYIGLAVDSAPAENATLASLTELADTGYARQVVNSDAVDWTSASTGTNDRKITSTTVNFANSSGSAWTPANIAFLATTVDNTGKLIASWPLTGAPVTINDLENLDVNCVLQLNG